MNLLFIGDSLIEYFDWQKGFPDYNVTNLGRSGESVEGLLSRVVEIKALCQHADSIFIMSGINNIAMSDENFFDSYRVILEKLSSFYPEAAIYIHSLLPAKVIFISNDLVDLANDNLRKLAAEKGLNYLDLYAEFVDTQGKPVANYLSEDGLHLSRRGYEAWVTFLKDFVQV